MWGFLFICLSAIDCIRAPFSDSRICFFLARDSMMLNFRGDRSMFRLFDDRQFSVPRQSRSQTLCLRGSRSFSSGHIRSAGRLRRVALLSSIWPPANRAVLWPLTNRSRHVTQQSATTIGVASTVCDRIRGSHRDISAKLELRYEMQRVAITPTCRLNLCAHIEKRRIMHIERVFLEWGFK